MIISLDTETTGLDIAHGARPFLVTWCEKDCNPCFVEWDVDPMTRKPEIDQDDLAYIIELIDAADTIYLHNSKFDWRALDSIGVYLPWEKVRDTLPMSHLLASNGGHRLEQLCYDYLSRDIKKFEVSVKEVTRIARSIAKRDYPTWRIAADGGEGMPSVKDSSDREEDKPWKNDMWLPRALIKAGCRQYIPEHWATVCSEYACGDSEHTLYLGLELEARIRAGGWWDIWDKHRRHLPRVACEMECYGLTARGDYTEATISEYQSHVAEAEAAVVSIAADHGHPLELGKGAALTDNMRDFFYGSQHVYCPRCKYRKRIKHWNDERVTDNTCPKCAKQKRAPATVRLHTESKPNLQLTPIVSAKTGRATLDGGAMKEYMQTLDEGDALRFIEILADKRMYDTALMYMEQYRRYWVPVANYPGYYRIHCSLNPCGTDHLRWASNSPNMQNVAGESKEISNRACFGPLPDREWWRMDYKSIESRLPAYEAGEPKMIEVFENPNSAPYWGNLYNLTASVLFPKEYWPHANIEGEFRKVHPRLYKKCKFFVLAKNYGAGRRKGDLLSGIENSYDLVDNEFPLLATLQRKYLRDAERDGFVQTLPRRSVDPTRGYPILPSRTEDGRVLSTTPFNYHISGTACDCKNVALVWCSDLCAKWRSEGFDAHIALEVHDELLFDFPRGSDMQENQWRARELHALMVKSGEDLVPSIPTPISIEYHTETWGSGIAIA